MMRIYISLITLLIFSLALVGCAEKRPDGMPKLYPVTLTVTQEGKPLPGAAISLCPVGGKSRFNAGAVTNESGVAQVQTHGKYLGAPEGDYIVTVKKDSIVRTGPWDQIPKEEEAARKFVQANQSKLKTEYFSVVNKKYGSDKTSDLKLKVGNQKAEAVLEVGPAVKDKLDNGG